MMKYPIEDGGGDDAVTKQQRTWLREPVGRILVRLGVVIEALIRDVLGGVLGCDSVK